MANRTTKKILCVGIWWPTFLKFCFKNVSQCEQCQKTGNMPQNIDYNELSPIPPMQAFEHQGIEFIGRVVPIEGT